MATFCLLFSRPIMAARHVWRLSATLQKGRLDVECRICNSFLRKGRGTLSHWSINEALHCRCFHTILLSLKHLTQGQQTAVPPPGNQTCNLNAASPAFTITKHTVIYHSSPISTIKPKIICLQKSTVIQHYKASLTDAGMGPQAVALVRQHGVENFKSVNFTTLHHFYGPGCRSIWPNKHGVACWPCYALRVLSQ